MEVHVVRDWIMSDYEKLMLEISCMQAQFLALIARENLEKMGKWEITSKQIASISSDVARVIAGGKYSGPK